MPVSNFFLQNLRVFLLNYIELILIALMIIIQWSISWQPVVSASVYNDLSPSDRWPKQMQQLLAWASPLE